MREEMNWVRNEIERLEGRIEVRVKELVALNERVDGIEKSVDCVAQVLEEKAKAAPSSTLRCSLIERLEDMPRMASAVLSSGGHLNFRDEFTNGLRTITIEIHEGK